MNENARKTIESLFENEVYKASVKIFAKMEFADAAAQRVARMAVQGLRSRRIVETKPEFDLVPGVNVLLVRTALAHLSEPALRRLLLDEWGRTLCYECFAEGVHPSRVRGEWDRVLAVASLTGPVVVSTHSTQAVDCAPFDRDEWVRRLILFDEDGPRRMIELEADQFRVAYDVGIEHVGEILISWGIW